VRQQSPAMEPDNNPQYIQVSKTSVTWLKTHLPGLSLVFSLSFIAYHLGGWFPAVGGPVFAILLGIGVKTILGDMDLLRDGIAFSAKQLLKCSVILIGAGLSLAEIWRTGKTALLLILVVVALGMLIVQLVGRWMKLDSVLTGLIGVGTAICGGTAIAAIAPIVRAREDQVVYAISTIFVFNVCAVVTYPVIGRLLGMEDIPFGYWAGLAIQDTSSVVAAGFSYSDAAGDTAAVVKLTRTLFLIPLSLIMALAMGLAWRINMKSEAQSGQMTNILKTFPWFVLGFIGLSALCTWELISEAMSAGMVFAGKYLIIMAMASIGMSTNLKDIRATGFKPMMLGCIAAVIIGIVSWLLVRLTVYG